LSLLTVFSTACMALVKQLKKTIFLTILFPAVN